MAGLELCEYLKQLEPSDVDLQPSFSCTCCLFWSKSFMFLSTLPIQSKSAATKTTPSIQSLDLPNY